MSAAHEVHNREVTPEEQARLRAIVEARFQTSMSVPEAFFATEAEQIAQACWAMAKRFHRGGRLLAFGNGSAATDAQHVSVEFVHPVIVGKRALPALALTTNSAALSRPAGSSPDGEAPFARQIRLLSRPEDIALGFLNDRRDSNVLEALLGAHKLGLLTLGLTGAGGATLLSQAALDFTFAVPSNDPLAVQETHETLYHVLWELVHVFFEHEGLL